MEFRSDTQWEIYMHDRSATIQQHFLINFATCNSGGYYDRGHQVGTQTPETTLRHVAQTIVLAGYYDPRQSYGSTNIDLNLSRLLKSHKTNNPEPKLQLDLPIQDIQCAADFYCTKLNLVTTLAAELLTIDLFLILRPGE